MQNITICNNLSAELVQSVDQCSHQNIFILTDEHTHRYCLPQLDLSRLKGVHTIVIGAEDVNKNISTLSDVWCKLSKGGATRHSLLINLGGGMVTDLGGFAAATFKRGINFINIPTTLLAMVDASVGGKTGINFNGLKNEIGAFCDAKHVLIDCQFLKTLNMENILSGYAEMLKHGLISNELHWLELIKYDFMSMDYDRLQQLVKASIEVKEKVVRKDPHERNIRKSLNLGHTVGHAFESFALKMQHPVLHGYAVAWGLVCELYLSYIKCGFPKDKMYHTIDFIKHHYGKLHFSCKDYDLLYELMMHDKKNLTANEINFTLLSDIGRVEIDHKASKDEIFELLDFYCEAL